MMMIFIMIFFYDNDYLYDDHDADEDEYLQMSEAILMTVRMPVMT